MFLVYFRPQILSPLILVCVPKIVWRFSKNDTKIDYIGLNNFVLKFYSSVNNRINIILSYLLLNEISNNGNTKIYCNILYHKKEKKYTTIFITKKNMKNQESMFVLFQFIFLSKSNLNCRRAMTRQGYLNVDNSLFVREPCYTAYYIINDV